MTHTLTTGAPEVSRNAWLMMAAGLAGSANMRAFDSALPQLADTLAITLGQTGHFAAAFALAYGLCQLPFGILGDRIDKPTLVRFLAISSVMVMILTMFASSYGDMLLLRLIAGGMASAVVPLSIAYIGDTVPFERRQMVLAYNMTALITGLMVGQVAGGIIAELVGWHGIPLFIALLYVPAIFGLRNEGRDAPAAASRHAPLSPLEAIRRIATNRFSRNVLGAGFLEGATVFAISAFFGVLLAVRFDLPLSVVGLLLTLNALGSISNLVVLRYLPASWGMRGHFTLGGLSAAGGVLILGLSPWLPLALVGLFLAGLGAAAIHNNLQTFASQMVPEARATAFATFASTFFLSQAIGGVIFATLLDLRGIREIFFWPVPILLFLVWWFTRQMLRQAAAKT